MRLWVRLSLGVREVEQIHQDGEDGRQAEHVLGEPPPVAVRRAAEGERLGERVVLVEDVHPPRVVRQPRDHALAVADAREELEERGGQQEERQVRDGRAERAADRAVPAGALRFRQGGTGRLAVLRREPLHVDLAARLRVEGCRR